jgi:uncharacterized protein YndB with AHSA1/START domain
VNSHTFDAPLDLVWKTWTDPKLIPRWWGPRIYATRVDTMDFRPGGTWRYVQTDADGKEFGFHGVYREIVPLQRIVDTFEFEGMPGHILVESAVFEKVGNKTKVTQKSTFETVEDLEGMLASGMEEGAAETIERFAELLEEAKKPQTQRGGRRRELLITRTFDAPIDRVWRAWTDARELKQWMGPKGFTTPVLSADVRVGGTFRICMRSPEGKDYWGTGVYREIVPKKKLVYTDSFADEKGNVVPATYYGMSPELPLEMVVTLTFEAEKGRTKVTLHHAGMPPGPDLEGATQGWNEMFDKLDKLLEP